MICILYFATFAVQLFLASVDVQYSTTHSYYRSVHLGMGEEAGGKGGGERGGREILSFPEHLQGRVRNPMR
jgi:hypothetical protein